MKIEIEEDRTIVLKEVYSHFVMETSEGNRISICMRDDTFEINVIPKDRDTEKPCMNWWRVNMQDGTIKSAFEDPPLPKAVHSLDAEAELAVIMGDPDRGRCPECHSFPDDNGYCNCPPV